MAIRRVTLQEAQEKGYEILGPTMLRQPEEPSGLDYAAIIGLEVAPAILGGIYGSYAGAAAGGALGNWASQEYRIWRGLQEEVSGGELAAATAFSVIPGGKLKGYSAPARIAMRGAQGSTIALGELYTRVGLERGEFANWNEVKATALFGGAFGGTLGAIEARMVSRVTKSGVREGMNRGETVKTVADDIESKGGYDSYKASAPEDLEIVLREMESKVGGPVASSTRAAEGIVDTLGEMTATQLSRDLQALASKAPPTTSSKGRPTIIGEDAAVTGPREMNDQEFAFHNLITSEEPTTMAGIAKARRLEKEKVLHFEERGKLAELEARRDALLHQEKHPDAPKDLPFKLKELNKAITKVEQKMEAFPKDLEKAIKSEQMKGGVEEPEVTLSPAVHRYMDNKNLWGTILVGGSGIAAMTEEESEGLFRAGLGPALLALAAAGAGVGGARALKASRRAGAKAAQATQIQSIPLGLNRGPVVDISLKRLSDNDFQNRRGLNRKELNELEAEYDADPTRVEKDLEQRKKLAKTQDQYEAFENEAFRRLIQESHPEDVAFKLRQLNALSEYDKTKIALLLDEVDKRGIGKQLEPYLREYADQSPDHAEVLMGKLEDVRKVSEELGITKLQGKSQKIQGFLPSLLVAGAGIGVITDDTKEGLSKADWMNTLLLLALGGVGAGMAAKRFRKIREMKYLSRNPQARKEAIDNIPRDKTTGQTRQEEVLVESMQRESEYKDSGYWGEVLQDAGQIIKELGVPMSRITKKISQVITRAFRDHELKVSKTISRYISVMEPFVVSMTRAIGKNEADLKQFKLGLLNSDMSKLRPLIDKYNGAATSILRKKFKVNLGAMAAHEKMRGALDHIRKYARTRGGYDVGYLENYFPRQIKNYKAFREFMVGHKSWSELQNAIDAEIQIYADKSYQGHAHLVPDPEKAEIASRVLRGGGTREGAGMPANFNNRKLALLDEFMVDGYLDPADALSEYVTKVVTGSETRHFLGYKPPREDVTVDVGVSEIKDVSPLLSDLGLKADLEDSIGGYVQREGEKLGLTVDEAAQLKQIVSARFSAKGTSAFIGALKNANYIATLGNFGAAITQLADPAYAIHFNGFGNTFKALFSKHNRDWYKRFGLQAKDIDMESSRDGLSKLLANVLKMVGFTKLDKIGKNVVMNSTFHRLRSEAMSSPRKLMQELEPIYKKEVTSQIIKDLRDGRLSDDVESVIWYKLSDLQPVSLMEMPIGYATSGKMRLAYMLKSFTIKQFDVFGQANKGHVAKANDAWAKGEHEKAAKHAGIAVYNTAALATVFGAMNASTSLIKDTIYGRETNYDELKWDTLWRIAGISRYNVWQTRREGIGKAAVELFMPPTAFIDRAHKDLTSLAQGEASSETFKSIGLGDFYYWHYGGGREKTRKAIAKKYGIELEYVPK